MRRTQQNLSRLLTAARRRLVMEDGQALIEYALILGLVALLTIGVLQAVGANVSGLLNKVSSNMSSVTNP
jgi:Flp pilus assembly pilin Flp